MLKIDELIDELKVGDIIVSVGLSKTEVVVLHTHDGFVFVQRTNKLLGCNCWSLSPYDFQNFWEKKKPEPVYAWLVTWNFKMNPLFSQDPGYGGVMYTSVSDVERATESKLFWRCDQVEIKI